MRRLIVSLGLILFATLGAAAADIPIPSQAEWADAKKTVELPNGQSIAYVEMGNPEGKPVLLIHGYTDNSRSWSLLAPYLKDRHLFAIDLRGHGKSGAPDCCYSISDFAVDAALFIETVAGGKADVVGHSLGSLTAQMLAARYPDRVNRIVLVSSSMRPGGAPGSWLWDNVMPLVPPIDPNGKFMTDWYWNPNPVDTDYIDRERAESAATPMHVWHGVLWDLAVTDLAPIASQIKAPVMVFWGDQDQLFDATHQAALKTAFPQARYETFAGAGHNMFWEFPEKAGGLIGGFLDEK